MAGKFWAQWHRVGAMGWPGSDLQLSAWVCEQAPAGSGARRHLYPMLGNSESP